MRKEVAEGRVSELVLNKGMEKGLQTASYTLCFLPPLIIVRANKVPHSYVSLLLNSFCQNPNLTSTQPKGSHHKQNGKNWEKFPNRLDPPSTSDI